MWGQKNRELICKSGKIVVPPTLQERVCQWYHVYLCHPGKNRTEQIIKQHFWFKNIRDQIQKVCSKCSVCQTKKNSQIKYGKLPEKIAETEPWDKLCIDLIGPYTITRKKQKPLTL